MSIARNFTNTQYCVLQYAGHYRAQPDWAAAEARAEGWHIVARDLPVYEAQQLAADFNNEDAHTPELDDLFTYDFTQPIEQRDLISDYDLVEVEDIDDGIRRVGEVLDWDGYVVKYAYGDEIRYGFQDTAELVAQADVPDWTVYDDIPHAQMEAAHTDAATILGSLIEAIASAAAATVGFGESEVA